VTAHPTSTTHRHQSNGRLKKRDLNPISPERKEKNRKGGGGVPQLSVGPIGTEDPKHPEKKAGETKC